MHSMTRARRRLGDAALIAGLAAAWVAAGAPAAVAARPATPVATGTQYGGYTSQDNPLTLTLGADRRHVTGLHVLAFAKCDDGNTFPYFAPAHFEPDLPPTVAEGDNVMIGGKLSKTGKMSVLGNAIVDLGDKMALVNETLIVKVRRGRATGTYDAEVKVMDRATNQQVASCSTGTLKWLAISQPGRVFAGRTSQNMPAVLALTSDGRKVDALRVGWFADCGDGGGYVFGDHLANFPVSATGVFGDGFDHDDTLDDGGHRSAHWDVAGKASAAKASGTIKVHETRTAADGSTAETCDTGTVRWSARSSKRTR